MASKGTVIVTGGSKGIGAAVVQTFLDRGYAVVATARNTSDSPFKESAHLALVDGDISKLGTAQAVASTASRGSVPSTISWQMLASSSASPLPSTPTRTTGHSLPLTSKASFTSPSSQ